MRYITLVAGVLFCFLANSFSGQAEAAQYKKGKYFNNTVEKYTLHRRKRLSRRGRKSRRLRRSRRSKRSRRSRRASRNRRGGVSVRVNLRKQLMAVYVNGRRRYSWRISSGKRGYATPRGVYGPKRFRKNYYSRTYGGAMPYSIFFRGGYAIHGTRHVKQIGRRASHGCIRLAPANAARLFSLMRRNGGRISIY